GALGHVSLCHRVEVVNRTHKDLESGCDQNKTGACANKCSGVARHELSGPRQSHEQTSNASQALCQLFPLHLGQLLDRRGENNHSNRQQDQSTCDEWKLGEARTSHSLVEEGHGTGQLKEHHGDSTESGCKLRRVDQSEHSHGGCEECDGPSDLDEGARLELSLHGAESLGDAAEHLPDVV